MSEMVFDFLKRNTSLIITTHDNADADGLGAERIFYEIASSMGKKVRIINSQHIPEHFRFMDKDNIVESWDEAKDELPSDTAMVILDTSDEYNIGKLKSFIPMAVEVMVIDHHEPNKFTKLKGLIDNTASSTCEIVVDLASQAGIKFSSDAAMAAYAGIVYDSGFFAYPKTTIRTFKAAITLIESGVVPNEIYRELNESGHMSSLMLEKAVLSTLEIHGKGRVAVQLLRKEDLLASGANYESAESFVNIPLRCKEIQVSVLVKENKEGNIRCSLRSKGSVNVSKIAQGLGGGGHVSAAGFKSSLSMDDTLGMILEKINEELSTGPEGEVSRAPEHL